MGSLSHDLCLPVQNKQFIIHSIEIHLLSRLLSSWVGGWE